MVPGALNISLGCGDYCNCRLGTGANDDCIFKQLLCSCPLLYMDTHDEVSALQHFWHSLHSVPPNRPDSKDIHAPILGQDGQT